MEKQKETGKKGRLLTSGTNMFRMMDACYNARPKLSIENTILEFNVDTDEWWIYERK